MIEARCLSREEAAAKCGLTPSGFSDWVRKGRMPRPLPGTRRWDARAIDLALDKLSGLADAAAPAGAYERWRAQRGEGRA